MLPLTIHIPKNENWHPDDLRHFEKIFIALVQSGGLSGVKGGKTIIHFDDKGDFRGIQLDYWPYRTQKS